MKRAYKLQEFVAHISNVNCLKIGKKSSRVLVTGGEDHKVNMWAIGKPNAILSLSGHSSAVESVTFDTAEVLVAAGAASGTIKLWDLEEAKIVRTLTGHRSNCIAVDFHPFGEFFASGSLDTNLKIWDIRRKGCIHTYKGHTRGVNAIKFSPDGRWVVSGGEDNIVKLWDLTAGKLMHDFKCHEGQILCLDFHPHEFLLATGSADRTVKFWDLETFELIGSAGPEASGIRSMIFNLDGRTLLAGLHESMKVFSWEPLRCYDVVDVGWSKLADLNIHEGKLLGCSYNQSCVGIWVVDLSHVGPYADNNSSHKNGTNIMNQPSQHMVDGSLKSSSVIRNVLPHMLESQMKEMKLNNPALCAESVPGTPQRSGNNLPAKVTASSSSTSSVCVLSSSRRAGTGKVQPASVVQPETAVLSRRSSSTETAISRPISEMNPLKPFPHALPSQISDPPDIDSLRGGIVCPKTIDPANLSDLGPRGPKSMVAKMMSSPALCTETPTEGMSIVNENEHVKCIGSGKFRRAVSAGAQKDIRARVMQQFPDDDHVVRYDDRYAGANESSLTADFGIGQAHSLVNTFEKKVFAARGEFAGRPTARTSVMTPGPLFLKGTRDTAEESPTASVNDVDAIEELMQEHNYFTNTMQSRITKLQIIRRFWTKNDLRGAVEAMAKMGDNSILVDVLSCLLERSEAFTLEVCTLLLPLLNGLLSSNLERYLSTALAVLAVLVQNFGQVIHTTRIASPSFGVDLHAEERFERCNTCYLELQVIMQNLAPLLRRGGEIGKSAQELSIALQEV